MRILPTSAQANPGSVDEVFLGFGLEPGNGPFFRVALKDISLADGSVEIASLLRMRRATPPPDLEVDANQYSLF